jgi:hypothetical protein
MSAYLVTSKNAQAFFNAIQTARAPERFTTKFLKDLDFASSNDRLYIGILKGIGFLDENGVPTQRYYAFLDHSQSRRVLAEAIRSAYDDLFGLNRSAQTMTADEVKGKFRSLTQGQKSENVINLMANTFETLCGLADWSESEREVSTGAEQPVPSTQEPPKAAEVKPPSEQVPTPAPRSRHLDLVYNIQIILPESRDEAVYDAIFTSLRRHLPQ